MTEEKKRETAEDGRREYEVLHPVRLGTRKRVGRGETILLDDEQAREFGAAVRLIPSTGNPVDPYAEDPYAEDPYRERPDDYVDRRDAEAGGNAPTVPDDPPADDPSSGDSTTGDVGGDPDARRDTEGNPSSPGDVPDGEDPVSVATAEATGEGVRASEGARQRARSLGVDLADVAGTGRNGSVTKADVERHYEANKPEGTSNPDELKEG